MRDISVDVLVTFYNQEQYVDQALESVFAQKGTFGLHVLIGDDGSQDNTLGKIQTWCEKYPDQIAVYQMSRDPNIKYVSGFRASQNRLNLLKHVSSTYYIFLDGDDFFCDENKLQKQIKILEAPENQDCIACGHAIDAMDLDGERRPFCRREEYFNKYDLKSYWEQIYFHTDTILARNTTIPNIPFDLVENSYNDNLVTFLLLQRGKIYYLPDPMAVYLQTGDGIWTEGNKIINNLRNMMLFDLTIMINPGIKTESMIRFTSTWRELFSLRDQIDKDKLLPFLEEAEGKNLKFTKLWIRYRELTAIQKKELFSSYCQVICRSYWCSGMRKIKTLKRRWHKF